MKVRVLKYDKNQDCYRCLDLSSNNKETYLLDLRVDGFFPDGIEPVKIIGMELDIGFIQPYMGIACDIN